MKEITAQYTSCPNCFFKGILIPFGDFDRREIEDEFKTNQLVKCRITRISKGMEPSIEQNNLLHACFELVSENRDYRSGKHAKEACKIAIDFRDMGIVMVRPDGGVQFNYRSYSFKSLPVGPERDRVMKQSFEWCADELGLTVEELVREVKQKMVSR